jgi:hypothetical protein
MITACAHGFRESEEGAFTLVRDMGGIEIVLHHKATSATGTKSTMG